MNPTMNTVMMDKVSFSWIMNARRYFLEVVTSYLLIYSPKFVQVRKSRDWKMLSLSKDAGRTEKCGQELEMGNLHQHYIDFKT